MRRFGSFMRASLVLVVLGALLPVSTVSAQGGSVITVRMAVKTGRESVSLFVQGQKVETWTPPTTNWAMQDYTFVHPTKANGGDIRLVLESGGSDLQMNVDWVQVDDVRMQTEDPRVVTKGSWVSGSSLTANCDEGSRRVEHVGCGGGWIQYFGDAAGPAAPAPQEGFACTYLVSGSEVTISRTGSGAADVQSYAAKSDGGGSWLGKFQGSNTVMTAQRSKIQSLGSIFAISIDSKGKIAEKSSFCTPAGGAPPAGPVAPAPTVPNDAPVVPQSEGDFDLSSLLLDGSNVNAALFPDFSGPREYTGNLKSFVRTNGKPRWTGAKTDKHRFDSSPDLDGWITTADLVFDLGGAVMTARGGTLDPSDVIEALGLDPLSQMQKHFPRCADISVQSETNVLYRATGNTIDVERMALDYRYLPNTGLDMEILSIDASGATASFDDEMVWALDADRNAMTRSGEPIVSFRDVQPGTPVELELVLLWRNPDSPGGQVINSLGLDDENAVCFSRLKFELLASLGKCGSHPVTHYKIGHDFNSEISSADDVVLATWSADGMAGDDVLCASRGQVYGVGLKGGPGDDIIYGTDSQRSRDVLRGGDDDDTIYGYGGGDEIFGDDGEDRLFGGDGDDLVDGGPGNDVVSGNSGDDTVIGGTGIDRIFGQDGIDSLYAVTKSAIATDTVDDALLDGGADQDFCYGGGATSVYRNCQYDDFADAISNGNPPTSIFDLPFDAFPDPKPDPWATVNSIFELMSRPEYTEEHAQILRLYHAYWNRAPDLVGAKYWLGIYDQGSSVTEISEHFTASKEFQNVYSGKSDTEFLNLVYRNVLERNPDAEGMEYWLRSMRNGLSQGAVVFWISRNPEFIDRYSY